MILSKEVKELIEKKGASARQLRRLVGADLGFEPRTIKTWSENNSPRLCSPAALTSISKHTGIIKSDILNKYISDVILSDGNDEINPITAPV